MFKTISDKLHSLWPYRTNSVDIVSTGSKRKRYNDECDVNDDPDLHVSQVEKKRKIESTQTFVGTLKTSVSNMAQWLRPKSKRFSEEFHVMPCNKKDSASTSINGDSIKVPQFLEDRHLNNHRFAGRHHNVSHYKGMTSNGRLNEVRDDVGQHVSTYPTKSSIYQQNKPSTASLCIRLREKEEYKKLLKLQSQRSPWQQQLPYEIPNTPSTVIESDVISVSSESSGDKYPQRTYNTVMETKPTPTVVSIPKHKVTPNSSNLVTVLPSRFKPSQTNSLLASLYEQHQRFSGYTSVRKSRGVTQTDLSSISNRSKDGPNRIETRVINEKNKDTSYKQLEPIVVIDDDDDDNQLKAAKSAFDTQPTTVVKDTQAQKANDIRFQSSFLQSRFMNDKDIEDERAARMEEQRRRKHQIEEEELKAKAFAEKRRAQEISLDKSLKYQMRIFDDEPQVCEDIFREDEEEVEKLPELTPEMQMVIDSALRSGSPNEILSEDFRLQITRADIKTLSGLSWLNDEVINFYMNLLMRSGELGERAKLYAFNTFFYPKVKTGGHSAVKRWTKNINIFAVHYIIIPVHLGVHWCLCVADMQKKLVTYYDSMGAKNNQCLYSVLQYIHDESIAKSYTAFNRNEWKQVNAEDNPQQMNGGDCGMFMCMYAEYITRGKEITFTQEHMPYFRRRMVYEIIKKKLLH
uniref:Ubiquitin-like protease family profile domain-containing protein n=1 Tax=Arion vulgaris TaxID=1028688 RepID=A0A0B6Z4U0_9EUPU